MHIEIQNCFSFWGTSSPDPLHRTSPTFCTRFTPLFTGGHVPVIEFRGMTLLNFLFCADVLRPLHLVPLTDLNKLLCPRGTQTCALAVANIKVNGNGKVILDTHPESDQHQN